MKWILLRETAKSGRDVDLPDSVVHRSVRGNTLILVPGHSRTITADEWEHIKSHHSDLLPYIQELD